MLNFTQSIVQGFTIGPENVQIGLNYYGNSATLAFNLNRYTNDSDILDAIAEIQWQDGETNTSGGIRMMYRDMFTAANGDRAGAPNIAIVITDGVSTRDENLTIPEADNARNQGITLFAIGIGDEVSQDELNGIANKPSANFVFNTSFDALSAIRQIVVSAACQVAASKSQLLPILQESVC